MQINISNILYERIGIDRSEWDTWLPTEHISRQEWQESVEWFVKEIRTSTGRPAFGLTEAEITVHYHKSLLKFCNLIETKL